MIRKILCLMFFVACTVQTACSADLFYGGAVGIDSILAEVNLQETGSVTITYTLSNQGAGSERMTLEYWDSSASLYLGNTPVLNPIVFGPGEQKSFVVRSGVDMTDLEPKTFTLDPTLLFDGKYNPNTVGESTIRVVLPKGVRSFISATRAFSARDETGEGRIRYEWRSKNEYPTPLTLKWTSFEIDLEVTKRVSSQTITEQNRNVIIEITVQNKGKDRVSNLSLSDNFVPSNFMAIKPLSEFFTLDTNTSDPRVFWWKDLGTLQPGEMKRISYSVRYIGILSQTYDIELTPTVIYQDGILVGVSNAVSIGLTAPIPASEHMTPQTTTPLSPIAGILAVGIAGVSALAIRRWR